MATEEDHERKQLREKLTAQQKELADLKVKYEADKKIMMDHIADLMREMKRIDEYRKKLASNKPQKNDDTPLTSSNDTSTDHQVKLYSSISNIVVAKAESNDGGHLDMDLLSYYCTGAMSGGRKEKPVIRIKAMEDNEYHVWFENEEDAEEVINKENHIFLGRRLTMKRFIGHWPPYHSIMVSNMSDEAADDDYLTRYFRSSKYGSGPETFVGIEMMSGEHGQIMAKVTFKDPLLPLVMVTNSLNSLKLGEEVQVEVCSSTGPSMEVTIFNNDLSTHIPPPVSVSGRLPLKPLLAGYFRKYPEVLEELVNEAELAVSIDENVAVIRPNGLDTSKSISEAVRIFRSLVLDSISIIDVDGVSVTGDSARYYSTEIQQCEGSKVIHEFHQNRISLVGHRQAVIDMEHNIERMCERYGATCTVPLQVTEECYLDPEDYVFLVKRGFEERVSSTNVKVLNCDVDWSIHITGLIDDVHRFKCQVLPTLTPHITFVTGISANGSKFIRGKQRTRLNSIVSRKGICMFFTPPDALESRFVLLCSDEEAVELAKQRLVELKQFVFF